MASCKRSRATNDAEESDSSLHDATNTKVADSTRLEDEYFWRDLLAKIASPSEDDIIQACDGINVDGIITNADEYHSIARQKLDVFPFKDVSSCWHRLYTDTSIVRGIKQIQNYELNVDHKRNTSDLNEPIHVLDMAMIMVGGYGREQMLREIYKKLGTLLTNINDHERYSKKTKIDNWLPSEKHSVPKLQFPVLQRLPKPSLSKFEKYITEQREPVVLKDIMDDWPAIEKWRSKDFWLTRTLEGRRLIPVEIGRTYVDESWSQEIIPFGQFLEQYINKETEEKGYLAQFDLFRHIPGLDADIMTPDYCYVDAPPPDPGTPVAKAKAKNKTSAEQSLQNDEVQKNIWFGPAWTISQLHHDPYHNIFCQVVGTKYVRLYSPEQSAKLYPYPEDELAPDGHHKIDMSNTSKVDIGAMEVSPSEDWDDKWPGLSEVPYQEVVLEAGQALYIPVGWWHYVRSCSVGISVSFWWE